MNEYNHLEIQNQEKTLEYLKCIIKAVEKTKSVGIKCEIETAKAREAMLSNDKNEMWRVLQEYIREYRDKIVKTNIAVIVPVDKNIYEQLTIQQVQMQLQIMIGFIYRYEAIHSTAKETIKKSLEKILESSGKFSKREIKLFIM